MPGKGLTFSAACWIALLAVIVLNAYAQARVEDAEEGDSAIVFGVLKEALSTEGSMQVAWEAKFLQGLGLKKVDEITWEKKDSQGYLRVKMFALPTGHSAFLEFVPTGRHRLSPAFLGALVETSTSTRLELGNALELLVAREERGSATVFHYIVVSLDDEAWVSSKVTVQSR